MAKTKKSTKKQANKKVSKSTKSANVKKTTAKKAEIKQTSQKQTVYEQLRLGESYISLVLGAIVVFVIFAMFMFLFIRGSEKTDIERVDVTPIVSPSGAPSVQTHIMQENESLWDVAVREYGDGYRYVEIIEANQDVITNPDFVPPGTKIKIPSK